MRWHEGRYDEALAITDTALEIDRQRNDELAVAGDLANRGFILKSMGRYEEARASLEEAIAMPAQAAEPATLTYILQGLAMSIVPSAISIAQWSCCSGPRRFPSVIAGRCCAPFT